MATTPCKLISYIAPSAPATRRPADGNEPFLRLEIGFTPNWYHKALGIDFGERWHVDPAYRRETIIAMRQELRLRFPNSRIGCIDRPDTPLDLLTGTHGACTMAAIYGIPIVYTKNNWPVCEHRYLTDHQTDTLEPPNLDTNPFFQDLMAQVGWIAEHQGRIEGYINWQSVVNTAQRLRGEALFFDLMENPDRIRRLFDCICSTMIEAAQRLYTRQRESGVSVDFFTVSNCLVNMISPEQYAEFILPIDQRIAKTFGCIGIHNCAWTADPYLHAYTQVPNVGYIDMGQHSDLKRTRALFPHARRAIMYTPMDLANKPLQEIRADLDRIAHEYGPCDIVAADIDAGTSDDRVVYFIQSCEEIGRMVEEEIM